MKKVFILGNPRSGTSLFRLMLNAHPLIISPPESGFLHWWFKKYSEWKWQGNSIEQLDNFIKDFASSKKIETWNLNYNLLKKNLIERKPTNYAQLGEFIYSFYATSIGKAPQIIADKNNYYIHHLKDLKTIWPDAYFIILARDGRDVACSYIDIQKLETNSPYKPELTDNIDGIAKEWTLNNETLLQFVSKMNDEKYIVLRFEDVVKQTENELKKVCEFLQIPFSENMFNYYKQENHNEPDVTLDWKKKTLTPPDSTSIDRYKSILSAEEIQRFNTIAVNTLLKFNYEI